MSVTVKHKNPQALRQVHDRFGKPGEKEIAVGFPKGMTNAYPDGTRVIDVAAWNVYGTKNIPQRDFMKLARAGIIKMCNPLLKTLAKTSNQQIADALREAAGLAAAAEIQKAIIELSDPPNAPSTVAAKGSDNPLIDTGHMKNAVTFVVRERTKK